MLSSSVFINERTNLFCLSLSAAQCKYWAQPRCAWKHSSKFLVYVDMTSSCRFVSSGAIMKIFHSITFQQHHWIEISWLWKQLEYSELTALFKTPVWDYLSFGIWSVILLEASIRRQVHWREGHEAGYGIYVYDKFWSYHSTEIKTLRTRKYSSNLCSSRCGVNCSLSYLFLANKSPSHPVWSLTAVTHLLQG